MVRKRIKRVLTLKPGRAEGGTRRQGRVLVLTLCCLLPLVAVTCATGPKAVLEPDDPLFGTWVNPEYEMNADLSGKLVLTPEGREFGYNLVSDSKTEYEGKFTVEEAWVDAQGNRWYKGQGKYWGWDPNIAAEGLWYFLYRINPAGTVLESVSSEVSYPEEMSRLGGAYGVWRKRL